MQNSSKVAFGARFEGPGPGHAGALEFQTAKAKDLPRTAYELLSTFVVSLQDIDAMHKAFHGGLSPIPTGILGRSIFVCEPCLMLPLQ